MPPPQQRATIHAMMWQMKQIYNVHVCTDLACNTRTCTMSIWCKNIVQYIHVAKLLLAQSSKLLGCFPVSIHPTLFLLKARSLPAIRSQPSVFANNQECTRLTNLLRRTVQPLALYTNLKMQATMHTSKAAARPTCAQLSSRSPGK